MMQVPLIERISGQKLEYIDKEVKMLPELVHTYSP